MLTMTEIKHFLDEDASSKKKMLAKKGVAYYESEHDIKQYRVFYINEDGLLQEDKTKSNERISHPFFTELTDQCVQYMLSGTKAYVRSDIPELQNYLNEYFDDDFKMELNDLLTYTGVEGFSYLYRYAGDDLKSRFKFADGLNVVEVPAKYASDKKDHVIYKYFYKKVKDKNVWKVEVWDEKQVHFYEMMESKLKKDEEAEINPRPHVLYHDGDETYYDTFGSVPFLRLDNNRKQHSDLKVIKDLIDDYDLMNCGLSNNIQDLSEGFFVVKGFKGHSIDELTQAVRGKKQIGVDDDGDVDIKTINIPYEARKTKLEIDEKNIYRFGMGFDSSKSETSNVTNVVIKSRYTLLNLKANKKEQQLRKMMKKVIEIVLDEINKNNQTDYKLKDVYMDFERVIPSNEVDNANIEQTKANTKQIEINTLLNLRDTLDDETLVKSICEVLEVDYEEIKDKLPSEEETLAAAQNTLLKENTEEEIKNTDSKEKVSIYKITSVIEKYKRKSITKRVADRLLRNLGLPQEDVDFYLSDEMVEEMVE